MKQKCLTMVKVMTALVLAVLMMVGSVSNVVGAVIGTAGFDGGTALISSAEKGLEIAENANISENADEADAAEPDLGFEDNAIVRGMKDDLAGTGANADLANTGWSNDEVRLAGSFNGWSDSNNKAHDFSGDVGYIDVTFSESGNYECKIVTATSSGTQWWGVPTTVTNPQLDTSSNSEYGLTTNDGGASNLTLTNVVAGDYTFKVWYTDQDKWKIKVQSRPSAPTWTVAGSNTDLFGEPTWDYTNADNDMTTTDDTNYVWSKKNVSLSAGSFEFKVFKNHNNAEAYPANNYVKTVDDAGNYDVTITFNSSTHDITVTLDRVYTVTVSVSEGGTTDHTGTNTGVSSTNGLLVKATPNTGYKFVKWEYTNATISTVATAATTTVKPSSDGATLKANFKKQEHTLTYNQSTGGTFTVTKTSDGSEVASGSKVEYDESLTVTCVPSTGYYVSNITIPGHSINNPGNTRAVNMPNQDATITVTFAKTSYTITSAVSPSKGGTCYVGTSANPSSATSTTYGIGDTRYYKATANAAYNFKNVVITYSDGTTVTKDTATDSFSLAGKTGAVTVTAYFTAKPTYPITVSSSNSSYGTASADLGYAYEGQTVTLTATEDSGDFGSWTVIKPTGGSVTISNNQFTMPGEAVSIRANFIAHEPEDSKYYYNGYSRTSGAPVQYGSRFTKGKISGQEYSYYRVTGRTETDQTFTVSVGNLNYNNQIYVGWQAPNNWNSSDWVANVDEQYIRFMTSDYNEIVGYKQMSYTNKLDDNSNNKTGFEYKIPNGARYAQIKCGKVDHYTNYIDLSTENNGGNNAFYITGTKLGNDYVVTGFPHDFGSGVTGDVYEYIGRADVYVGQYNTGGFNSINDLKLDVDGNKQDGHVVCYPNQDMSGYGDYYIIVLEPNTEYTINGVKRTTGTTIEVLWMKELPITPDENAVTVYAKDGTLRGVDGGNEYETFAKYADTKIYDAGGNAVGTPLSKNGTAYSYETYGAVKGETITIETTISNTTATGYGTSKFNELYYVKGFCINGEVPDGTINNSGLSAGTAVDGGTKYTLTYTIPENLDGNKLEITPIYYTADPNVTTVTFQVDNFPAGEHNWGNTLYVYPFYGKLSGANNAMGAYPGQPMVYYGGQYYIQVPTKSYSPFTYDTRDNDRLTGDDAAAKAANRKTVSVSGMTLHNGFYDLLHREIWGLDHGNQKNDQTQTYDYDDFYKIYNEKGSDNIIFQYKYETTTDNKSVLSSFTPSDATHFADEFDNGFEDLVDYKGRKVNLFGTVLLESKLNNNPIYVVSEAGGESNSTGNIAGQFATQWHIFVPSSINGANPTYSKFTVSGGKTSIPPSVLLLEDEDSFNNTTYPSALDGHSITDWKTYYTNLKKNYKDYPVLITYEKAKNDVDSDQATRNDGRWLFSATGEPISSNIRIDISQDNGEHYYPNGDSHLIEDPGNHTGSSYTVPDVSAYFTNLGVNGQQTYSTTLDSDKTYDFTALSNNANYKFMGWYFDNGKKISGAASATTLRNNSYTFVARFMYVNVGTLLLSHVNGKGKVNGTGTDYQGKGNVSIAVTVTDEEGITVFSDTKSGESITIPATYIGSDKNFDVSVTLTATPANNNAYGTTVLTKPTGYDATFFNYGTASTGADGKTKTYTFGFNVKDDLYDGNTQRTKELVYTSYFIPYTFNYDINYEYYDRFDTVENGEHTGTKKVYNRSGTLTADEAEAYVYKKTSTYDGREETHRRLKSEFVASLAPVVSNFGEDILWDFSFEPDFGGEHSGSNYVYSINVHYEAVNNKDMKRNVTFVLPYDHVDGIATLTDGVGTEATATNYALIKESEQTDNRVNFGEIPVLTGGRSNGIYTEEEKAHWIAAPATIKDATDPSKIKNFNYWSIASTSAPTVEVARCYFAGFNFVAYDNYIITAVYDVNPIDISSEEAQTYITFLETTRNQWNSGGNTTANPKDRALAADVLFNDFVLNYSYKAQDLYLQNDGEGDIRNLGVVVQRMDQLETSSDGSFNTDLSNYVVDPTSTETNAIKAMINDPTGSKISGTTVQAIAKNSLDNKNRIEIFEAIYNAAGWNKDNQKFTTNYAYKKYLYRAFSYMIDASGNIILSEKPAYFIMYDVATATNDN